MAAQASRDESNAVIGPTPLRPAMRPIQKSSRVLPKGVTAPSPVMTTLFLPKFVLKVL